MYCQMVTKEKAWKTGKVKILARIIAIIVLELVLVAGIVVVFDPFYQYHAPWFGLKAVLNDRDNQMPGTIRNFDYDSVLIGSSVAENFDSSFLDAEYGINTLKIIRASGSMADLNYYLELAHEKQELKQIFWCLDIFALDASTEVTLYGEDVPRYLHTETILDDVTYLYNKEILLEKIPYMLACSMQGLNTGGHAYDWSRGKDFSVEGAKRAYNRTAVAPDVTIQQKDSETNKDTVDTNVSMLLNEVESHADITYRFILPPYSLLWWDSAYLNGDVEQRFYALEQVISALLEYENVEIYYFQAEEDIVCNLDNYMDMIHYTPEINQYMLECVVAGEKRLTQENYKEALQNMRDLTERISKEEIYRYYPL